MPSALPEAIKAAFPLALIVVSFAGLTAWSWRKWPDLLVDFGMQLYTPWQLLSGKILHKDLTYLAGGPLSQYTHALVFRLFGVSLTSLAVFNLCVIGLLVWLLYRLFLSAADRWTATAVCLVTLFVFSFSQYVGIGNYNYVCPYTVETFHGLVLSIAAIACLTRWLQSRRNIWAFAGGFFCGAVFLTKPDLYLALLFCMAAALIVCWAVPALRFTARTKPLLFLLAGHSVLIVVFLLYYCEVWTFRGGLRAVAAAWVPVLATSATRNAYYRWCLGLDQPLHHLVLMLEYFVGFCVVVGFLGICSRLFLRGHILVSGLLAGPLFLLVSGAWYAFSWPQSGIPLAPLTLIGCVGIAWKSWKLRNSADVRTLLFPLLWSVFALILLSKLGLNTRIWHYGFYLAMPAAAFMVFALMWLIPRESRKFGIDPVVFRVFVVLLLGIGICQLVRLSNSYYRFKDFAIGQRGDRILTYGTRVTTEAEGMRQTLCWLEENTRPSDTLAVFPEAVIINYLARRSNPTRFPVLPPPEFQAHGEAKILSAYKQAMPDVIVLVHRDDSEYGVRLFGHEPGFGQELMRWVRANYSPVWAYGHEPFETDGFGIRILARKPTVGSELQAVPETASRAEMHGPHVFREQRAEDGSVL